LKVSPKNGPEIRETISSLSSSRWRLDANRSFELKGSLAFFSKLPEETIEYVEEPLSQANYSDIEEFYQKTGLHVALDESIYRKDSDIEALASLEAVSTFVIKPGFIGSLKRISEVVKLAKENSKKIVFSSGFDFYFGMACNFQLAAAVAEPEPAGFDTFRYFKIPDRMPKLDWEQSTVQCSSLPGLGLGEKAEEIFSFYTR